MSRTPQHVPPLPGAAVVLALALACVPKDPYDPGPATAAPDDSTGAGSTTDAPDDPTAATTYPDDPTTGGGDPGTTGEPGTSDSGDSTGPGVAECAFTPPGVQLALTRILQGDPEDMSIQSCGHTSPDTHYTVVATDPEKLELAACADPGCGACDDADRLVLALSIPDPLPGLPPDPVPGECVRLTASWERPLDDADLCTISALALLRTDGGVPEPVPRFMYRHTETLPATDSHGPFALTGAPSGPGDLTCPCDADCCDEPPGSRRLQFTATLGKAEIEVPPMLPGDVYPAFAFGTPEGDDLFGELALVRAFVPAACDEPAQYEWLLRVTP
jgi:hypothetical protein